MQRPRQREAPSPFVFVRVRDSGLVEHEHAHEHAHEHEHEHVGLVRCWVRAEVAARTDPALSAQALAGFGRDPLVGDLAMSKRENTRGSVAPEGRHGALRSVPPANDAGPSGLQRIAKPAKNAQQCIRHDARSAFHSLSGFLELLGSGTLGGTSEEQRLAIAHIRGSAHRLLELLESSVELASPAEALPESELRLVCLEGLVLTIVNSALREQPTPHLELQSASGSHGLLVNVEPEALTRTLAALISLVAGPTQRDVQLRLSQTDLHAVLLLSSLREEGSVTQSMPVAYPAASSVDDVSEQLESCDYIRLKRCESIVQRQHGALQVAADLSRVRIKLPKIIG